MMKIVYRACNKGLKPNTILLVFTNVHNLCLSLQPTRVDGSGSGHGGKIDSLARRFKSTICSPNSQYEREVCARPLLPRLQANAGCQVDD